MTRTTALAALVAALSLSGCSGGVEITDEDRQQAEYNCIFRGLDERTDPDGFDRCVEGDLPRLVCDSGDIVKDQDCLSEVREQLRD